jgi:hypothetical protein
MYRKRAPADAEKKAVERVWRALWVDSKKIFGRKKAGLTQADVQHLFQVRGIHPDLSWRVVPKDPDDDWGLNNAVVVPKNVRKELVSVFTENTNNSVERYNQLLNACRSRY